MKTTLLQQWKTKMKKQQPTTMQNNQTRQRKTTMKHNNEKPHCNKIMKHNYENNKRNTMKTTMKHNSEKQQSYNDVNVNETEEWKINNHTRIVQK
jgi:hypothetical protein